MFVKSNTNSVADYVKNDLFFLGMKNAFEQQGHEVILEGSDSYYFSANRAYRWPFLYKVFWKISRKTGLYKFDRKRFSQRIAEQVRKENIHAIFTEVNFNIDPKVIKAECPDVKVTQWFGILPDQMTKEQVAIVNDYDHHFCPVKYDAWLEACHVDSSKFNYMSSGCLSTEEIYHDLDNDHAYDVCFVGGVGGVHKNRLEILEFIANKVPSFAFYGYGEKDIPEGYTLKNRFKGWVDHRGMRKVFSSSKIALNIPSVNYDRITHGYNIRLIEIAGCQGALQICSSHKNIAEFYQEEEEIITFDSKEDLLEKIQFILRHEPVRKQMVDQAYEKALMHSYENKIHRILKVIEG